ncbi:glycoside hydrolase family 5 protein [Candidatus Pelagisphaera phototrophica]|uniref:glycoside hydrolase family 5 protein n=1 Tax=Candidatus Pelagisphaera phototrophica TaxID=2684113 RepID=UPI0019FC71C1|nr:cellulase family glycosylhydrolase [Candidatus Pelagisphaera phototrophica]QXD31752.1 glycoside hydrolase family 5 protein [Candidatus Pelagisphaera phototrophica]
MNKNGFRISRGTNISHLFVDKHLPRGDRKSYFNERDISQILKLGFDHIRIPFVEDRLWFSNGEKNAEAFSQLNHVVNQSIKAGLKVILCFQELKSHQFSSMGAITPALFLDSNEVDLFCDKWSELSSHFKSTPESSLAYELLNEPLAPSDEDWNNVLAQIYNFIRKKEPNRTLVIGPNFFQWPVKMKHLKLDARDQNIIRSFHFYHPHLFTHNKTPWSATGKYEGPVTYPGRPVPKQFEKELESLGPYPKRENLPVTLTIIQNILKDVDSNPKQAMHPIHCGEFGCYHKVPLELQKLWFYDVVSSFEKAGIAWTQWDWKGNFGILDKDTWRPSGIHLAMGLNTPKWGFPKIPGSTLKEKLRHRASRVLAKFPPLYTLLKTIKK